jgi:plasmid stabilization system protein ParE
MRYRVVVPPEAAEELDEVVGWIARQAPENAIRWYERLLDSIRSLADFPQRCPVAPEAASVGMEIRQLLFGDYRILFTISGKVVQALHVRHAARRAGESGP